MARKSTTAKTKPVSLKAQTIDLIQSQMRVTPAEAAAEYERQYNRIAKQTRAYNTLMGASHKASRVLYNWWASMGSPSQTETFIVTQMHTKVPKTAKVQARLFIGWADSAYNDLKEFITLSGLDDLAKELRTQNPLMFFELIRDVANTATELNRNKDPNERGQWYLGDSYTTEREYREEFERWIEQEAQAAQRDDDNVPIRR